MNYYLSWLADNWPEEGYYISSILIDDDSENTPDLLPPNVIFHKYIWADNEKKAGESLKKMLISKYRDAEIIPYSDKGFDAG